MAKDEDKLEVRLMDEFFAIEKHVGQVKAIVGLQFASESAAASEGVEYYEFTEAEKEAHKPKPPAEGEEQPEGDGGEAKPTTFNPTEYQWTVSNKQPKNLPSLFVRCKGKANTKHEVKKADQYSTSGESDAIQQSLDALCKQIQTDAGYLYAQVIFKE